MSKDVFERPAGLDDDAPRFSRTQSSVTWWSCGDCGYQFHCESDFSSMTCARCHGSATKD